MKLGTLKEGGREGTLIVVSRDLGSAIRATDVARTLREALESWQDAAPRLQQIYDRLNAGTAASFELDHSQLAAP
ncbi:MAG: 2-keto-4-pentenoate hydratase, partial [Steroidobacter sp.]